MNADNSPGLGRAFLTRVGGEIRDREGWKDFNTSGSGIL